MKTLQERCIRTLFFFSETPAVLIKKIGLLVEPQWRWPFVDVGASENNATAKFFAAKNAVRGFPTLCLFLFFGSLFGQRKTSANDGCKKRCGARSCSVMTSAYCLPAVFYMASAFAFCFCFCIFIFLSSFAFVRVCINSSLQPNSPSSSPATPSTPHPHPSPPPPPAPSELWSSPPFALEEAAKQKKDIGVRLSCRQSIYAKQKVFFCSSPLKTLQ